MQAEHNCSKRRVPVEDEQKELAEHRRATYTEADWGMHYESDDEEVVSTVRAAAMLTLPGTSDEDVPWFAAHLAAHHARRAAALDAEMSPEYRAYIMESIAAQFRNHLSEDARRAARQEVSDRHNADALSVASRKARDEAERAELEWQRNSFNDYARGVFG